MEVEDIQSQQQPGTKYSRVNSNGTRLESSKMGLTGSGGDSSGGGGGSNLDERMDILRRAGPVSVTAAMNGGGGEVVAGNRFGRQWQHSSRIIRVSRASGGKDRHSKVWTAKGPRDRRVRLSVTTAIQFYDLQDRLGYDQPSKAVEWLIKAAAGAINELPSLDTTNFPPETPRQLGDERRSGTNNGGVDPAEVEFNGSQFVQEHGHQQQVGSMSISKSGSSSNNSETSKGSGLSLSRSEMRARARERTAKAKKEKESEATRVSVAAHAHAHAHTQLQSNHNQQQHNVSSMGQTASFTQLLTAGISNLNENAAASSTPSPHHGSNTARGRSNDATSDHLQWLSSNGTSPMADYFETGLMGLSTTRPNHSIQQLSDQVMTASPFGGTHSEIHHQHQRFSSMADLHHHLIQAPNNTTTTTTGAGTGASGGHYNLNFSISPSSTTSGLGFNRGTLQSNSSTSPSLLSYLQRYSSTDGVSSVPFFLGGAPISPAVDNQPHHHHHNPAYNPAGLQLCYGDGGRHSEPKPKAKN